MDYDYGNTSLQHIGIRIIKRPIGQKHSNLKVPKNVVKITE